MRLKLLLLFVTILFIPKIYSQEIEYQISMIGEPQEIFLKKDNDQNYIGYIITEFYKPNKYFIGIPLRKYKEIKIKTDLQPNIVKELMTDLNNAGIIDLKKCESDEECKTIKFLDSDFLVFKIKSKNAYSEFKYPEVYPENKSINNIEKNNLRRKAQIMISIIDNKLNLKDHFRNALKKVGKPYCYHCGGVSSCCSK